MDNLVKSFANDIQSVTKNSQQAGPMLRKLVADYAAKGVSRECLREFVKEPYKSVGMRIAWASPVDDCPEKRLVIAIIDQSMQDLLGRFGEKNRLAAKRFFESERFFFYCDKLGVDEDYGRDCVNDALLFSAN